MADIKLGLTTLESNALSLAREHVELAKLVEASVAFGVSADAFDALTRQLMEPLVGFQDQLAVTQTALSSVMDATAVVASQSELMRQIAASAALVQSVNQGFQSLLEARLPIPDFVGAARAVDERHPPLVDVPLPHRFARVAQGDQSRGSAASLTLNVLADDRYFSKPALAAIQRWVHEQLVTNGASSLPGCGCHQRSASEGTALCILVTRDEATSSLLFQCSECLKRDFRGEWPELRQSLAGPVVLDGGHNESAPRTGHLRTVPSDE